MPTQTTLALVGFGNAPSPDTDRSNGESCAHGLFNSRDTLRQSVLADITKELQCDVKVLGRDPLHVGGELLDLLLDLGDPLLRSSAIKTATNVRITFMVFVHSSAREGPQLSKDAVLSISSAAWMP